MVQSSSNTNLAARIPPQDIEAEKALLGSIMLRSESLYDAFDVITSASFYGGKHRIVFETILELNAKHTPVDLLSLSARLKEKKQLDHIGGYSYLTELSHAVPSAANTKHYADIIQKKFVLRKLIEAADNLHVLGFSEERDLEDILDDAERKILSVTGITTNHTFSSLKDSLSEAWERIDRLNKMEQGLRGVPSGFHQLDNMLSGFQKSDLIVLAARPSMGKTALALDIARQSATQHNVPVGIFSLEMSAQQLVDRVLAAESRVDAWKLRTGQIRSDDDFSKLQSALGRLSAAPLYIDDTPGMNIMQIRSAARRMKREHNLGLLIVDYLQLINTPRHYDSMVHQVTEISRSLKSLARELELPVIALSQLSRAIETRRDRPRLSDLRDSGSIEQDSDVVMFIHRPDKYSDNPDEKTNIVELMIEKHRNGPTGKVDLYFDEKRVTFMSLEKDAAYQKTDNAVPASTDDF